MADAADYNNPDDWELADDYGFVYKRKKRPRDDTTAPPPPDPELEKTRRRELQKRSLLKLKDKYSKEISRWERLSNTLREMEKGAQTESSERQQPRLTTSFGAASGSEEHPASTSTSPRVVDDLLSQVEAQEAIIQNVSNLCDVAEALNSAQGERWRQQFTDLPIWQPSPAELMAILGER